MKFFLIALFTAISIVSCSTYKLYGPISQDSFRVSTRKPASSEIEKLVFYLNLDRFLYYVTEFVHSQNGKVPDAAISALKDLDAQYVMSNLSDFPENLLSDSSQFDNLINKYLLKKQAITSSQKVSWGYNFLKKKLNAGFIVRDGKVVARRNFPEITQENPDGIWQEFTVDTMDPSEQTLDSNQYISDRMTRAVFWEAIDSDRTVEFHPTNPREFLKNVAKDGGEIIGEVKTKGSNYNKIYLVKYPNEDTHRLAITNVGGEERLEHLLYHLSLSNIFNKDISNKVVLKGDFVVERARMKSRLINKLKHLPPADRTIIGQTAAIQNRFYLHWKMANIDKMYSKKNAKLKELLGSNYNKVVALMNDFNSDSFNIEKNKKFINDTFAKVQKFMEADNFLEPRFNRYTFDNSVFNFGDVVFKNSEGKTVRWRLVSNAWGDEVIPAGEALKETGHKLITYIGTAGAFEGKGLEVGDVVAPSHVSHMNEEGPGKPLQGDLMEIDLDSDSYKVGGTVNHVSTPFVETNEWLARMREHADTVEIETSYLRDIFDDEDDFLRVYLMVSDIMGSEGETLAAGSASKRKKGKLALIDALFARDKAKKLLPIPTAELSNTQKLRNRIEEVFPKKGTIFKYYLFSLFENESNVPSFADIKAKGESIKGFSDNAFTKKSLQAGEILEAIVEKITESDPMPMIGLSESYVDGKWHPGTDKLEIEMIAESNEVVESYRELITQFEPQLNKLKKWLNISVKSGAPTEGMHALRPRGQIDDDYLIRRYVWSGMRQGGLDFQITGSGNFAYNFLPTIERSEGFGGGDEYRYLAYFKASDETLISAEKLVQSNELLSEINEEYLKIKVEELSERIDLFGQSQAFRANAKYTVVDPSELSNGALAEIVPEFDEEKGITYHLKITQEGLNNPLVILEEVAHFTQIVGPLGYYGNNSFFAHPVNFIEMSVNAKAGSKRAQYQLALAELDAISLVREHYANNYNPSQELDDYIANRQKDAELLVKKAKKAQSVENKIRKESVPEHWKEMLKDLDKADLKLDDFIAANNRQAVVEVIETYMPWHEMEPTEIAVWRRWLKAIETPNEVEGENNVMLFRGLESDLVRESDDGGHFIMSTLLTKNQGSYNRRLRSLKTVLKKMRKKSLEGVHPSYNSITSVFKGHSEDPVGSPLMSLSTLEEGLDWSEGLNRQKLAAINISRDRLLFSYFSRFENEVERLVPLIVFPDEIVHLEDKSYEEGGIVYEDFKQKVEEKINRPLVESEISQTANDIDELLRSKRWWDAIQPNNFDYENSSQACENILYYFMNQ